MARRCAGGRCQRCRGIRRRGRVNQWRRRLQPAGPRQTWRIRVVAWLVRGRAVAAMRIGHQVGVVLPARCRWGAKRRRQLGGILRRTRSSQLDKTWRRARTRWPKWRTRLRRSGPLGCTQRHLAFANWHSSLASRRPGRQIRHPRIPAGRWRGKRPSSRRRDDRPHSRSRQGGVAGQGTRQRHRRSRLCGQVAPRSYTRRRRQVQRWSSGASRAAGHPRRSIGRQAPSSADGAVLSKNVIQTVGSAAARRPATEVAG